MNLSLHANEKIGIQWLLGHGTSELNVNIRDPNIVEYEASSNNLIAKRVGATIAVMSYLLGTQSHSIVIAIEVVPNIDVSSDSLQIFGKNLLISFDDSQKTDYTKVLRILNKFGVPAEFCVWTYQIDDSSNAKLHKDELLTLATTNEIVSHSRYHIALAGGTLLTASPKGSYIVHTNVDSNFKWGKFRTFQISNGSSSEIVEVTGVESKNGSSYVKLAKPLIGDYPAGSTLAMTTESIENEAAESKQWLNDLGIKCSGFSYPFGRTDNRSEQIIKKYYTTARIASPIRSDRSNIYDSVYQDSVPNRFEMNAIDFSY